MQRQIKNRVISRVQVLQTKIVMVRGAWSFWSVLTPVVLGASILQSCSSSGDGLDASPSGSNTKNTVIHGRNGQDGTNGLNGANCFDAPGTTDLNGDGVINVQDCRGPAGRDAENTEWKLLAESHSFTRAGEIFIDDDGIRHYISSNHNNQKIDSFMSPWPETAPVELIFIANNRHGNFCVGGAGAVLTWNPFQATNATCSDVRVNGASGTNIPAISNSTPSTLGTWIRLIANDSVLIDCPSQSFDRNPPPGAPGIRGFHDYWKVTCHYSKTLGDWNGDLTRLRVQQVHANGTASGTWEWKILYR